MKKLKFGLATQILIGLILGVVVGAIFSVTQALRLI